MTHHAVELAGRADVRVASGADGSLAGSRILVDLSKYPSESIARVGPT